MRFFWTDRDWARSRLTQIPALLPQPDATNAPEGPSGPCSKRCWTNQRLSLKHVAPQSLYTPTWQRGGPSLVGAAFSGVLDVEPRQEAGSCVWGKLPLGSWGWYQAGRAWYPMVPGKMPVGIRRKSWHRGVGFSSGISRDVPPPALQKGKGAGSFWYKLEQQTSPFQLGVENRKQCSVPISAGELTPAGLGRPLFNPPFSTTQGPKPTYSPL